MGGRVDDLDGTPGHPFWKPGPVFGQINLGVLKKDEVNVVVHGHEPLLPEILADVVNAPEIQERPRRSGQRESIWPACAAPPMRS